MADELSFIPEDTGGGVIDIAKKIALDKAAQIAKEALQTVDKTGVITSQLTPDDLIEIGTGIQEGDKDKIKNVIGVNLEKIHSSVPEAILTAAGINLAQPEMLAMNITNQLVQTGGSVVGGLAEWDIPGDNIISKGAEGMFDVADIIANNPQYGITPNLANMVSGINRTYGNVIGRPLGWAGQKMYDFTSPLFDLLGSPFQTKTKVGGVEIPSEILSLAASDPVPIGGINQPNVITNDDGTQTLTGGTTDPSDDITVANLPPQVPRPTMADVAGPSTPPPGYTPTPSLPNTPPPGYTPTPTPSLPNTGPPGRPVRGPHWAQQGGLVSMARVLRR